MVLHNRQINDEMGLFNEIIDAFAKPEQFNDDEWKSYIRGVISFSDSPTHAMLYVNECIELFRK